MKNTIEQGLSPRDLSDAEDLLPWANKELRPLVKQIRAALNSEYTATFKVTTPGDGAFTNVWTSDALPTNSAWLIEVRAIGFVAGSTDACGYIRRGIFYNDDGTVAQVDTTTDEYTEEANAACDVRLQVSGQTIQFDVKDDGVDPYLFVIKVNALHTVGA